MSMVKVLIEDFEYPPGSDTYWRVAATVEVEAEANGYHAVDGFDIDIRCANCKVNHIASYRDVDALQDAAEAACKVDAVEQAEARAAASWEA